MENQSTKYGNVQKCPQCGAPVEPMAVKCSTCGYEFRNVEALRSAQQLAEKLDAVDLAYQGVKDSILNPNIDKINTSKISIIKNFPVPTTKEDLLDFAISMQSRWNTEQSLLRAAYKSKYDECVNKAKILFPNDPMFQGIFTQHQEDKKKMSPTTKYLIVLGIITLVPLIIGLLFAIIYFMKNGL